MLEQTKNEYILGNGNTAYILALILGHDTIYVNKEKDVIHQNGMLANVITIPLDELTKEELEFLKSKIDFSSAIVRKKIGFLYDGKIYNKASQQMIYDYIHKQKRENVKVKNDFSFKTEYDTIDISKLLDLFKDNIKIKYITKELLDNEHSVFFVTNQQVDKETTFTTEYVIKSVNDMHGYSYIYDCNRNSKIKRFSADATEYIEQIDGSMVIKNYNGLPTVHSDYDILNDNTYFYIGRYASKTRMLLSHVIKFAIKYKETIK